MSGTMKLLCASSLVALTVAAGSPAAFAQAAIKIGVSGAATGPASPNYLPNIEAFRMYVRGINDRGGINGHAVNLLQGDRDGQLAHDELLRLTLLVGCAAAAARL